MCDMKAKSKLSETLIVRICSWMTSRKLFFFVKKARQSLFCVHEKENKITICHFREMLLPFFSCFYDSRGKCRWKQGLGSDEANDGCKVFFRMCKLNHMLLLQGIFFDGRVDEWEKLINFGIHFRIGLSF